MTTFAKAPAALERALSTGAALTAARIIDAPGKSLRRFDSGTLAQALKVLHAHLHSRATECRRAHVTWVLSINDWTIRHCAEGIETVLHARAGTSPNDVHIATAIAMLGAA